MRRRSLLALAAAAPWRPLAHGAADPLSRLDAAQRRGVQEVLRKNSRRGEGDAQADAVEAADIDGDGRPELVLLWTFLGPTFAWSRVTVLSQGSGGWRDVASADVNGQAERMRVQGREIAIETLTLGPRDARCCPSVRRVQRLHWRGGRLVAAP